MLLAYNIAPRGTPVGKSGGTRLASCGRIVGQPETGLEEINGDLLEADF
jgi:hypothetical protein